MILIATVIVAAMLLLIIGVARAAGRRRPTPQPAIREPRTLSRDQAALDRLIEAALAYNDDDALRSAIAEWEAQR